MRTPPPSATSSRRTWPGGAPRRQKRAGQRDYTPVREWAAQNGYTLSDRGRIPATVLEAYDAAH